MRTIAVALFAATLFLAPPSAWAAQPAAEPALQIPHMSHEQALAYVEKRQLALAPSNLVNPVLSGDAETVEALLSAGVDANDMTDMPKPALRLAASACARKELKPGATLTMIEVLLAHGAKVNEPAPSELSPLMVAAQHCPTAVVRRLLKAGADMKFKTSLGLSPLSTAFIMGNLDAAEALIDGGARLSPEAAAKLLKDHQDDARRVALVKKASGK
ncbi:MAG: ankyrin repeat domain-containing protein [Thermoanaerobaculia bacterium]